MAVESHIQKDLEGSGNVQLVMAYKADLDVDAPRAGVGREAFKILHGATSFGHSGPHRGIHGHIAVYDRRSKQYVLPGGGQSKVPLSEAQYKTICEEFNISNLLMARFTGETVTQRMVPYDAGNPRACVRFRRDSREAVWIKLFKSQVYLPFAEHYFGKQHSEARVQSFKQLFRFPQLPMENMCVMFAFAFMDMDTRGDYELHVGTLDIQTNEGWIEHFGDDGKVGLIR